MTAVARMSRTFILPSLSVPGRHSAGRRRAPPSSVASRSFRVADDTRSATLARIRTTTDPYMRSSRRSVRLPVRWVGRPHPPRMRRLRRRPRGARHLFATDQAVSDLAQELDLHPQELEPALGQVVPKLGELDLSLAKGVSLELPVSLPVCNDGQREVPQAQQD